MEATQPFTILAVDDNPVNLTLMKMILSKEGYRVITAPGGPRARALSVAEKPDLILLDIQMPGEDGFEVIRFLKENPATGGIPVIFLTSEKEIDSKLKGFDLGAVDYITKPFNRREMLARVGIHLKLSIATNSLIAEQARKLRQITEAQNAMLPLAEEFPNARFGVYYKALEEAGGDFYDILEISDQITGYFVADFSGHDIKTSYMTAALKALLAQNCSPVYSPLESMKMINDVLVEILTDGKYLTACYVWLNRSTGRLRIISAGHPPVVHIPKGKDPEVIRVDGDILGMFTDARFGIHRIRVAPGDRLFIYSDGLVESVKQKIPWATGAESLVEKFKEIRAVPYGDAPVALMETIFDKGDVPEDDVVVLCVEV
ncbi:MAG: fused response regulator/phosphatase [Desulfobacterium sp.]|nr:fused response regulator/phosphatase [Desulfobacterium sp.]